MWEPTDSSYQENGECTKKSNESLIEYFFSNEPEEKYAAKNLCFQCPVRRECVKWALENKQIWGVWGGRDENEIRRALSVNADGDEIRRDRYPQCPYCTARTSKLQSHVVENPTGGRWTTMRLVECLDCGFVWRSRTSANAVNAYHAERADKTARRLNRKPTRR
jgi:WhiB family transcriptional regulator, redox-sensing transcriptional regulator